MSLSRGASAAMLTELAKSVWYPVVLLYLDWPGAAVRVHSSVGAISWGGQTWTGVGHYGEARVADEALSLVPSEATLRLYGVPDDIYGMLDEPVRNRDGALYVGALDGRGSNTLAADPVEVFAGYIDAMRLDERLEDAGGQVMLRRAVELTLGSGPSARTGGRVTHSAEDQQSRHPSDTAGRLVIYNSAQARKLQWPAP